MKKQTIKWRRYLTALTVVCLVLVFVFLLLGREVSNPEIVVPYDGTNIYGTALTASGPGGSPRMLCTTDALLSYGKDGKVIVSENPGDSMACSWDGQKWIYYDKQKEAVFSWSDAEDSHQCLADLSGMDFPGITSLYHVDNYLILCSWKNSYKLDLRSGLLEEIDLSIIEREWTFIYRDWLINVQPINEIILAYRVSTDETVRADICCDSSVMDDFSTNVAYASDAEYLYLSMYHCAKLSGNVAIQDTYAIDLETLETHHLSGSYYGALRRTESGLWGMGFIPIKLPDDAP